MIFHTKTLELPQILDTISQYAKTESVKEKILSLHPERNLQIIQEKLIKTEDLLSMIEGYSPIPFLDNFDIAGLFEMLDKNMDLTLSDVLTIFLFLKMETDIRRYFQTLKAQNISLKSIASYEQNLTKHQTLYTYIEDRIDPDGLIRDDATVKLYEIRSGLKKLEKSLQDRLSKLLNQYAPYLSESFVVQRNGRYCIPVKEAYKNKVKGIIHDVSASGQTLYIEPESILMLMSDQEKLRAQEKEEVRRILAEISANCHHHLETLSKNLDIYLALDFIQAKALYAKKIHACMPFINQEGTIQLVHARHPLLDPKTAVPISLTLNQTHKTLMITGSNTGGKTVALKTVGLLTLMLQSGILVPADKTSHFAIFKQVFADIGDEQSIVQSLSTFSSHVVRFIEIVKHNSDGSLILLDEIGSGTDPIEGVSLAIALIESLNTKDIRMMVTTHYSELKQFAFETPYMQTASVSFDTETLRPLYQLKMNTLGSSYALLIAKRYGMPEDILKRADLIYSSRQTETSKLLEKLSLEKEQLAKEKEAVDAELNALTLEKEHYIKLQNELKRKENQVLTAIREQEEEKLESLREQLKQTIASLEHKETDKPTLAQAKSVLNQKVATQTQTSIEQTLKVGDYVYILSYQQYGTITKIKKETYLVRFGSFELWFSGNDLILEKETPKKKAPLRQKNYTSSLPKSHAKMDLDLRGVRFEDVKNLLDEAIDQAILGNLHQLRVIHGFGTGAVKKAVYDYIKSSSNIKDSRLGQEGEGSQGVTILSLK